MSEKPESPVNADWIREKTNALWGRDYWRSLEQLSGSPEFLEYLENEFPEQARALPDEVSRREFLKYMGASLVLAGLGGCTRQPLEKIVPYVKSPEQMVPGKPLYFATSMPFGRSAQGLLIESHMGRPTKAEGNPEHPESLGATDAFAQASLLGLYDPDRSQVVHNRGRISTWNAFLAEVDPLLKAQKARGGAGLRILSAPVNSPTLRAQMKAFKDQYSEAKWHQYEPVNDDAARAGTRLAFGEDVRTIYKPGNAEIIVTLDSDFLNAGPGHVRYLREFAKQRRVRAAKKEMNRLYAIESFPTGTGSLADHKLVLPSAHVPHAAIALARALGVETPAPGSMMTPHLPWIQAVAQDLRKHQGKTLVVAGDHQLPVVHAFAHAMNAALGAFGKTVVFAEPAETGPSQTESICELAADMEAGKVELLLILGTNPVFDAPAELDFAKKLEKVKMRVHLGLYADETEALSHWHIPEAHFLESWGDAESYDGTASFIQPLIEPLYGGKSIYDLTALVLGKSGQSSYDAVRDYWKGRKPDGFEAFWRKALHDGFVAGSAAAAKNVTLRSLPRTPLAENLGLEIMFRPDASVWDGRFANNAWLQELPKPLTKLTWDNAFILGPETAQTLDLKNGDVLEAESLGRKVEGPVWILPGHPKNSITVHLGYGRRRTGRVGTGTGFDAYPLRVSFSPWTARSPQVRKTGKTAQLVSTQDHSSLEGRNIVRVGTLEEFRKHEHFVHDMGHEPAKDLTLYPPHAYPDYAWGMAIDIGACTSCNACVVACQAENNVPVVGKKEVARGREMHWLRIDRYFTGSPEAPETVHQPVPCMHCEDAPCEPVCPVGATSHSKEGLNEMTYNRCVGTRYCSNNCPYKVRRFNFFEYSDQHTESLKMLRNPDVTVRSRGVMEKCTYCVQRINVARIEAKKGDRKIKDGEIKTACQSVCPAEAIIFGDLNDPESLVSKLKAEPLNYAMLAELNTKPRTTYLARIQNPNPEIGPAHG